MPLRPTANTLIQMSGNYLLDTSVIIDLFAANTTVVARLEQVESTFIPSIAVGELYYGAQRSSKKAANLEQISQFVNAGIVLPCDSDTGHWYGIVKNQLRKAGHPIPENDIWIAAIAFQYDLTVATRDKHFVVVDGLQVEIW